MSYTHRNSATKIFRTNEIFSRDSIQSERLQTVKRGQTDEISMQMHTWTRFAELYVYRGITILYDWDTIEERLGSLTSLCLRDSLLLSPPSTSPRRPFFRPSRHRYTFPRAVTGIPIFSESSHLQPPPQLDSPHSLDSVFRPRVNSRRNL